MSKVMKQVGIEATEKNWVQVEALIDDGLFYTRIREDRIPEDVRWQRFGPKPFGRSRIGGKWRASGWIHLGVRIEGREIDTGAMVCPKLPADMIIGRETMYPWGISIQNKNGRPRVRVLRDRNDPEIRTVLCHE